MRDRRQDVQTLRQKCGNASTHGVESVRRAHHFRRPDLGERLSRAIQVQAIGSDGQTPKRADGGPYRQPGHQAENQQLEAEQRHRRCRDAQLGPVELQRDRTGVVQQQAELDLFAAVASRDAGRGPDAGGADSRGDRFANHPRQIGLVVRRRGRSCQYIAIVLALDARQPGTSFLGRDAVEDGQRCGDIASHVSQHQAAPELGALEQHPAHGQGVRQRQAAEQDDREATEQRIPEATPRGLQPERHHGWRSGAGPTEAQNT